MNFSIYFNCPAPFIEGQQSCREPEIQEQAVHIYREVSATRRMAKRRGHKFLRRFLAASCPRRCSSDGYLVLGGTVEESHIAERL